ncbi:hypothetical protein C5O23_13425 [Duncaniella muris]|uniref:Uncharacterized protein n=1 Tax=Duncaniella muris TaxID=2094150 RepID=A0A2V1IL93_9BACT|nr:hypothetical protein C5O23_13425 [Duncaniella muris]
MEMSDKLLTILMLIGVLAFIGFIAFMAVRAVKLRNRVNAMKMPPNINQIRRKSLWFAIIVITLSCIFAYIVTYQ